MDGELILCIPGPWRDKADFTTRFNSYEPKGRYLCVVGMLADALERDSVPMDFREAQTDLSQAFYKAGKGKIRADILQRIAANKSYIYLRFPADIAAQHMRIVKFTSLLRALGGYALMIDPIGPAHEWEQWLSCLSAQNSLYHYNAVVMLGRDVDYHFSCGMRYFGLPDVEISVNTPVTEAIEVMNQFNSWQISTRPHIESGLTYSVTPESQFYFIEPQTDRRYDGDSTFCNPYGVCRLIKK